MTQNEIQRFFDKRPKCKAFYLVENMIFLNEERANDVANGRKVEVVERPSASSGTGNKVEMTADEAKAKLAEINLDEKPDYETMKAIAKALDVEVKGNKKADYIEALKGFIDKQ